ncbi:PHD finger protein EHD3-like [Vicia villosa]|uniref:PHD finger protein EHD3-like n=1 Tax=Vicia villosa TaxID=3911 RepID=UPI00273CCDF0|nr:PHD finger protein EHD3-like [Vicia villosa]
MNTEEGMGNPDDNTECSGGVQGLKLEAVSDEVPILNGDGVAEEARGLKSEAVNGDCCFDMGAEEGVSSLGDTKCAEGIRCLKRKAISDEVPISNGNGVAEEVRHLKSEAVNDGVVFAIGNGVADVAGVLKSEVLNNGVNGNGVFEEARHSKSEAMSNGVVFGYGNEVTDVARVLKSEASNSAFNVNGVFEEERHLKSEDVNNGVVFANGNGVIDVAGVLESKISSNGVNGNGVFVEDRHSKSEAMNDGVVLANGNGITDVAGDLKSEVLNSGVNENGVIEEGGVLKSERVSNGVPIADGFDSGEGGSGGLTCLLTYKRRKYDKSSSKGKAKEDWRKCMETTSHMADQAVKEPFDATLGNTENDCAHRHWGNDVLKHSYQSLGNVDGGIEGCIGQALVQHPQRSCATTVMQGTSKIDKDGHGFSSQFDCLSHRPQAEANGHTHVKQNGSSSEPHNHGGTEKCQRLLHDILNSEKFNSLRNTLLENFKGIEPESVLDFSIVNTRMKQKTYEPSPALFLSDIQQVWRKLQDVGNEISALSKSLSIMSTTFYSELVGVSAQSTFEDEKQVELDSHMKPEQTEECTTYKICCCSRCGERADGTDCLVCDSCEKVYHLSCIEPAVKEIPHKSWYCTNCTTSGFGSPHENCVVCTRLNDAMTPKKIIGDESLTTYEETLNGFEEKSNYSYDGVQVSKGGEKTLDCKVCGYEVLVDGEKIRICGHPFCPSNYYHVRCLTSKQLNSYGRWWYCPSCLCQVCLVDHDDDQIILCDGCDHAYHIHCMKPPLSSIPKGKWFCKKCDAGIKAISQAKRAYENNKLRIGENVSNPRGNNENNCNNKCVEELESVGGMDMLLTAANSLNFEDNLTENQFE